LQLQYADGHSNNGHFDVSDYKDANHNEAVWGNQIEARRAYFGFKSKWFQTWKLEGQIDVDTDGLDGAGPDHTLYKDIYDLFLTYAPTDALNVSVGKQEIKFSREQEISSKEIMTFERSLVTNMFHPGNLTGTWVSGKGIQEHWLYELGVYGNDQVREFSNFDGGALVLGKIGYDYSAQSHLDSAIVSFRYLHDTAPGYRSTEYFNNFSPSTTPSFSDCLALSNDIVHGRFGLTTDVLYGFGFQGTAEQNGVDKSLDQPDVFAINIIPSYFIADGLQIAGRLQYATSQGADGLGLQSRYESAAPSTDKKGNTYTSAYLGLNYYIYGHKLKLMNGVEYSRLGGGDYDGYTFLSGLRMYF
jgi:phosphate-selective porin OprO/OprP